MCSSDPEGAFRQLLPEIPLIGGSSWWTACAGPALRSRGFFAPAQTRGLGASERSGRTPQSRSLGRHPRQAIEVLGASRSSGSFSRARTLGMWSSSGRRNASRFEPTCSGASAAGGPETRRPSASLAWASWRGRCQPARCAQCGSCRSSTRGAITQCSRCYRSRIAYRHCSQSKARSSARPSSSAEVCPGVEAIETLPGNSDSDQPLLHRRRPREDSPSSIVTSRRDRGVPTASEAVPAAGGPLAPRAISTPRSPDGGGSRASPSHFSRVR